MKKLTIRVVLLTLCLLFVSCSSGGDATKKNASSRMLQENTSHVSSDSSSSESAPSSSSSPQSSSQATSSASSAATPSSQAVPSSSASSSQTGRVNVNVTIPEGYCVPQIADVLQSKEICSKAAFLAAVNSYPFQEASIGAIPYDPAKMCYRLEGYLYPDTYHFYKNMDAEDAIGMMLKNADNKIVNKYSFQTVILASIIEKEVPDAEGMKNVSSVFHNRLNNTSKFPYLGSDATVFYLTKYLQKIDNEMGSGLVEKYKYFYNTNNRIKGLPVGPICNPGAVALDAAANPASTDYLYFASNSAGNYIFSPTKIDASSLG